MYDVACKRTQHKVGGGHHRRNFRKVPRIPNRTRSFTDSDFSLGFFAALLSTSITLAHISSSVLQKKKTFLSGVGWGVECIPPPAPPFQCISMSLNSVQIFAIDRPVDMKAMADDESHRRSIKLKLQSDPSGLGNSRRCRPFTPLGHGRAQPNCASKALSEQLATVQSPR